MRLSLSAAFALCVISFAAHATTLQQGFTISGSGITASGSLTLMTTSTPGVDYVTGITGTYSSTKGAFSGAITGLVPGSYSASNPSFTANDLSEYDNLYYPSSSTATCAGSTTNSVLDTCGIDFLVANTYGVNLFATGATFAISDYVATGNTYLDDTVPVSVALNVTPEPSSFALLGTGLLGVAGVVRKRLA